MGKAGGEVDWGGRKEIRRGEGLGKEVMIGESDERGVGDSGGDDLEIRKKGGGYKE